MPFYNFSIKHSSKPPTFADNSRANTARREFLVRFNGGVPEKTSMKMSDLIYYNPSTNPMVATDPQKPTESAGEEIKNESTPEESPRIKPEAEEKVRIGSLCLAFNSFKFSHITGNCHASTSAEIRTGWRNDS